MTKASSPVHHVSFAVLASGKVRIKRILAAMQLVFILLVVTVVEYSYGFLLLSNNHRHTNPANHHNNNNLAVFVSSSFSWYNKDAPKATTKGLPQQHQHHPRHYRGIVSAAAASAVTTTTTTTIFDSIAEYTLMCLRESDQQFERGTEEEEETNNSKKKKKKKKENYWINDDNNNNDDDATAVVLLLQQLIDSVQLQIPQHRTTGITLDRDNDATAKAYEYIRWMKSTPTPMIIDFSSDLRLSAAASINTTTATITATTAMSKEERAEKNKVSMLLSRMTAKLVILPSGTELSQPLTEPSGSLIYGKVLFGSVTARDIATKATRKQDKRRRATGKAQEQQRITTTSTGTVEELNPPPCWIQYGGPNRRYEAIDRGSAAVLEITLIPPQPLPSQYKPKQLSTTRPEKGDGRNTGTNGDAHSGNGNDFENENMIVQNCVWKPQDMFGTVTKVGSKNESEPFLSQQTAVAGKDRNDAFSSEFQMEVGGLQPQIDAIVRRVLDGRILRPAPTVGSVQQQQQQPQQYVNNSNNDTTVTTNSSTVTTTAVDKELDEMTTALTTVTLEAQELAILGLTPVRGLLLYGPPGTGKTLLARQIAKALRARTPKIVSAPELLDRWVGGSEKLVRGLFSEAEAELSACNGDIARSALHVIVIDEIDAVFRRRSSGDDSGEQTRASVVNQILAKLDGVNAIDNILMIGMTNRRELLDSALLRPGRLEVQIEVPMPDKEGRRQILNIHFDILRKKGRLSQQLLYAIDGLPFSPPPSSLILVRDTDTMEESNSNSINGIVSSSKEQKRDKFKRRLSMLYHKIRPCYDLATETENFSGADLAGLVRSAGSLALSRSRKDGSGVDGILITLEDAKQAIEEVKK